MNKLADCLPHGKEILILQGQVKQYPRELRLLLYPRFQPFRALRPLRLLRPVVIPRNLTFGRSGIPAKTAPIVWILDFESRCRK